MKTLLERFSTRIMVFSLIAASMSFTGCAASVYRVRMGDLANTLGNLTGVDGDPLDKEKVEYKISGNNSYDEPIRSAAYIRAGMTVSIAFTEALTSNLKKFARTHAANTEIDKNKEDINDEEAINILNSKKSELSKEEIAYFTSSIANVALLITYMDTVVTESQSLTERLISLSGSVSNDFTGANAIKAPAVSQGLKGATENMKEASIKAPELAKRLARLAEGLKSLV